MHTLSSHINGGSHHNLISGTHYSCERREYVLMVLREYTIIFPLKVGEIWVVFS